MLACRPRRFSLARLIRRTRLSRLTRSALALTPLMPWRAVTPVFAAVVAAPAPAAAAVPGAPALTTGGGTAIGRRASGGQPGLATVTSPSKTVSSDRSAFDHWAETS